MTPDFQSTLQKKARKRGILFSLFLPSGKTKLSPIFWQPPVYCHQNSGIFPHTIVAVRFLTRDFTGFASKTHPLANLIRKLPQAKSTKEDCDFLKNHF